MNSENQPHKASEETQRAEREILKKEIPTFYRIHNWLYSHVPLDKIILAIKSVVYFLLLILVIISFIHRQTNTTTFYVLCVIVMAFSDVMVKRRQPFAVYKFITYDRAGMSRPFVFGCWVVANFARVYVIVEFVKLFMRN